jgi:hypothetical protein
MTTERERIQWYQAIGAVLVINLLAVLLLGTWVQHYNPGLLPLRIIFG